MATSVGGDLKEVSYSHETLGSGSFYPKAGEESEFDPGGLRTADDVNNVDGGNGHIKIMTQVGWRVGTNTPWNMATGQELEKLKALAANPVDAQWTLTHVSGAIWKGTGGVLGDVKGNAGTANIPFTIGGGGELSQL